ncbi:MAG: ammonia-forming cytochrome c nitrite reductase subunit c552 [Rectinemataceae bacterium]|jgi:nitrite reductase (cytochrome c-552)
MVGVNAKSSATAAVGTDIDSWSRTYPTESAMMAKGKQMLPSPSGYDGSVPVEKAIAQPAMGINYKGSAYATSFKEKRGHVYSWEDISTTKRLNDKTPASCITCKTPDIAKVFADKDWAYASEPAMNYIKEQHPAIDCFSCHNPATRQLRVIVPSFAEGMKLRGIDLAKATPKAMEIYVCAQCHSTYFLEPKINRVVSPWGKGLGPEAMYVWYASKPSGFEKDYVQPDSGVAVLKARHPDYELFSSGVHASAGVSCVDCHMPYVVANGAKLRQHWVTSPLRNVGSSCLQCHWGRTEAWAMGRVKYVQDSVFSLQRIAGQAVAEAHGRSPRLLDLRASLRRLSIRLETFSGRRNGTGTLSHPPTRPVSMIPCKPSGASRSRSIWLVAPRPQRKDRRLPRASASDSA